MIHLTTNKKRLGAVNEGRETVDGQVQVTLNLLLAVVYDPLLHLRYKRSTQERPDHCFQPTTCQAFVGDAVIITCDKFLPGVFLLILSHDILQR